MSSAILPSNPSGASSEPFIFIFKKTLPSAENTSGLGSIHKSWNNRHFIVVSVLLLFVASISQWQPTSEGLLVQRSDWNTGAGRPLLDPALLQHLVFGRDARQHRPASLPTGTRILYSFPIDSATFQHYIKIGF